MNLLIGFLAFTLVVNCLFLILLVLVQLPKKEAGAGLAFGAGAVDTLIGAGSGNALTKMTKYAAGTFMGLAIILAVLNALRHQGTSRFLQQELAKKSSAAPMFVPPAPGSETAPSTGSLGTNTPLNAAPPTGTPVQPSTAPELRISPGPIPSKAPAPTSAVPGLSIVPDSVQPDSANPNTLAPSTNTAPPANP